MARACLLAGWVGACLSAPCPPIPNPKDGPISYVDITTHTISPSHPNPQPTTQAAGGDPSAASQPQVSTLSDSGVEIKSVLDALSKGSAPSVPVPLPAAASAAVDDKVRGLLGGLCRVKGNACHVCAGSRRLLTIQSNYGTSHRRRPRARASRSPTKTTRR